MTAVDSGDSLALGDQGDRGACLLKAWTLETKTRCEILAPHSQAT